LVWEFDKSKITLTYDQWFGTRPYLDKRINHAWHRNLDRSVRDHPQHKFIFFGGKGGVGKTVMAGVTSQWFAL
jgi:hypothetical protein